MEVSVQFTYEGFQIDAKVEAEFEPKTRTTPGYFDFYLLIQLHLFM